MDPAHMRWDTKAVRGPREETDPTTLAHRFPIYQTSTFVFENARQGGQAFSGEVSHYIYTRLGNPTVELLEQKLAQLESTEAGIVFASGMAAIATTLLALVKPGERVVASDPLYGGTFHFFHIAQEHFGIEVHYIKASEFHEKLAEALTPNTRLVYIETPANPTLDIVDIAETAKITRQAGIPLVVDNTFASPALQRPIELGADLVLHSLTKYINGHGDVVGGALVGPRDLIEPIRKDFHVHVGGIMAPLNAFLVLRGTKTLHLRMQRHSENALEVARFLEGHPKVARVFYPGLPSHPQHEVAKKQMKGGFSGMVSFILKGGKEAGIQVMDHVKLWTLAVSLGDTDSLIEHPASMTHSSYSPEELARAGIDPGLVRLSVGIEDVQDLIDDLDQALKYA